MDTPPSDKKFIRCSFCGKEQTQVQHLIAGKDAFICDKCIIESRRVIQREAEAQADVHVSDTNKSPIDKQDNEEYRQPTSPLFTPKHIHQKLDEYVIAQHNAKKRLSVAIFTHYQRIFYNYKNLKTNIELDKSNILMIGPSGSGKTLLASMLAKTVDVPFVIADATTLTEAGYVGDDVENILLKLIQNADYDVERAEKGIIFIDEIDKINRKSENPSITRDVSGEGVQQALLKIIEGTTASVPIKGGRKHPQSQNISINTKNILFICGGAFIGLKDTIKKRLNTNTIGFEQSYNYQKKEEVVHLVNTDDLVKYGLIPELVGRLPIVTTLEELDEVALKDILIKPKNAIIKQFKTLLQLCDINFEVENSALDYIVNLAKTMAIGARGMRNVLEGIMCEVIYEAPEHKNEKVILSAKTIKSKKFFYPNPTSTVSAKNVSANNNNKSKDKKSKSA